MSIDSHHLTPNFLYSFTLHKASHYRMTSKALGSDIKKGTRVSVVDPTPSFPQVSHQTWQNKTPELVGTELKVAIQGLQAPDRMTDYFLLEPGRYSITHEQAYGSSRFKVTSQATGGSTGWISASDSKSRDPAYFIVTTLAATSEQAHMHSLSAGSEAILEVRDNYMGFHVTPASEASRYYYYHVEGGTIRPKLSKCWHTNA